MDDGRAKDERAIFTCNKKAMDAPPAFTTVSLTEEVQSAALKDS